MIKSKTVLCIGLLNHYSDCKPCKIQLFIHKQYSVKQDDDVALSFAGGHFMVSNPSRVLSTTNHTACISCHVYKVSFLM